VSPLVAPGVVKGYQASASFDPIEDVSASSPRTRGPSDVEDTRLPLQPAPAGLTPGRERRGDGTFVTDRGGCLNLLTPRRPQIKGTEAMASNSCLVEVERWHA
jgi:hypothetical protein